MTWVLPTARPLHAPTLGRAASAFSLWNAAPRMPRLSPSFCSTCPPPLDSPPSGPRTFRERRQTHCLCLLAGDPPGFSIPRRINPSSTCGSRGPRSLGPASRPHRMPPAPALRPPSPVSAPQTAQCFLTPGPLYVPWSERLSSSARCPARTRGCDHASKWADESVRERISQSTPKQGLMSPRTFLLVRVGAGGSVWPSGPGRKDGGPASRLCCVLRFWREPEPAPLWISVPLLPLNRPQDSFL